ncbi:hypothetical protein FOZ62_003547 [Perkinsus olseni]|uniref:Uncharacterized protein n=1 Tax=Perkinsus olseni TaxID=32597 RepID=A0A7J6S8M5_PEROL|nr:hypothetical protein FOZ62_003547 [Perkinsus olseni]
MRPNHMVVMEDEIFVAVSRSDWSEIRHFKWQGSIEVIVVWPATAAVNGGKILHLNPGSVKPLCLNIVLVDNSITYLVPLERVREAAPVVFKAKARRPLMNLPTRLAESLIVGSNTFRVRRPDGQYALVGVHPGLVSDNFSLWSSSLLTCPSHAASDLAGNIYLVFDRCPGQQSSIFGHQLQQQASDDPPENRLAFYHRPRRTSGGPPESRQGSHNRRQSAFHTWVREASGNSPETRQGSNERGQSTFNSWRGETSSGSPATGSLFSGGPLQASASTLECRAIPDYRLLRASPYLHLLLVCLSMQSASIEGPYSLMLQRFLWGIRARTGATTFTAAAALGLGVMFLPVGVLKERDTEPSNSVKESVFYALPMLPAFYFHFNFSLHPVWSLPILYLAGWTGMMGGQALAVTDTAMEDSARTS